MIHFDDHLLGLGWNPAIKFTISTVFRNHQGVAKRLEVAGRNDLGRSRLASVAYMIHYCGSCSNKSPTWNNVAQVFRAKTSRTALEGHPFFKGKNKTLTRPKRDGGRWIFFDAGWQHFQRHRHRSPRIFRVSNISYFYPWGNHPIWLIFTN